ncbi:hypothetical protein GC169_12265 [bacterium]|nr:hypothetical protein [bacterium]
MPDWTIGVEIELACRPGRTRADLAARTAARTGGAVRRVFHQQSEPSEVAGRPVFENLTLGFEVSDAAGRPVAAFVDDLTLQRDFDKAASPVHGWYRIVGDDGRLMRLAARLCSADDPLETVLEPLARAFGTAVQVHESGLRKVSDDRGASIAIAAPLPGERERPCEIVTAPIERDHERVLAALLADAAAEECFAPVEGAVHVHFDAARLKSAPVVARMIDLFGERAEALKRRFATNPHCVRLGPWPDPVTALARDEGFRRLAWPEAARALRQAGVGKYCDFNLANLAIGDPAKDTFEVRILPAGMTAGEIVEAADVFEAMLVECCGG